MTKRDRQELHGRVKAWIRDGDAHEMDSFDEEVFWGVWFGKGSDMVELPQGVFRTKEMAEVFGALWCPGNWHVMPVLVDMTVRDNYEVPT